VSFLREKTKEMCGGEKMFRTEKQRVQEKFKEPKKGGTRKLEGGMGRKSVGKGEGYGVPGWEIVRKR